jgi:hypothetical protein
MEADPHPGTFSIYLEYPAMVKVHEPSNSEHLSHNLPRSLHIYSGVFPRHCFHSDKTGKLQLMQGLREIGTM